MYEATIKKVFPKFEGSRNTCYGADVTLDNGDCVYTRVYGSDGYSPNDSVNVGVTIYKTPAVTREGRPYLKDNCTLVIL